MSSRLHPQAQRPRSTWLALLLCVASLAASQGCSAAPQRETTAVDAPPTKKRGSGRPLFSVRVLGPGERSATQVQPQLR